MKPLGLALTLQDAAALAESWGQRTGIARGTVGTADIYAPSGLRFSEDEAILAVKGGAGRCFLSFGNQAAGPDMSSLAVILETLTQRAGLAFMAACFAAPALGRTVYQGHLFQDGRLTVNLRHALSEYLSGRVAVIAHEVVAAGPAAIRRRLGACREQGVALALLDAVDMTQCAAIAGGLEGQLLTAGPAWMEAATVAPEPPAPTGRLAILSGALDRQSLYQLGAARAAVPFLQLEAFTQAETAEAVIWAAAQGQKFIISASAPPDRLRREAPVAAALADIAAGLAAQGVSRFLITGNDTASAILDRLGVSQLTAGAAQDGLRWLRGGDYNFLLKPGGFGDQNLFLGEFGPQIRLNAAAE